MSKGFSLPALVPARGGSKGIKNKNLKDVHGLPMFAYGVLAALASKYVRPVYVSSDSDEILRVAELYGAVPLKRPSHLAQDSSTTESVVTHFFNEHPTKHLALIQPTSPMLLAEDLDGGIEKYLEGEYNSLFSACRTDDVLLWDEDAMYPINYDPVNRGLRQRRKRHVIHENGAFFVFARKDFVEANCRMCKKIGWYEMPYWRSFQVDTPEDLERVRTLMSFRS